MSSHPTSLKPTLYYPAIYSSVPSHFTPSDFPTSTLYAFLFYPIHLHATCSVQLILLYVVTLIMFGKDYIWGSSSICNFLHFPFTSFLIDPHVFLKTILPKTLGLVFMRETQVLHPYNTKVNIVSVAALVSKAVNHEEVLNFFLMEAIQLCSSKYMCITYLLT